MLRDVRQERRQSRPAPQGIRASVRLFWVCGAEKEYVCPSYKTMTVTRLCLPGEVFYGPSCLISQCLSQFGRDRSLIIQIILDRAQPRVYGCVVEPKEPTI